MPFYEEFRPEWEIRHSRGGLMSRPAYEIIIPHFVLRPTTIRRCRGFKELLGEIESRGPTTAYCIDKKTMKPEEVSAIQSLLEKLAKTASQEHKETMH